VRTALTERVIAMPVRKRGGAWQIDVRHNGRRYQKHCPKEVTSSRAADAYERKVLADLRVGINPFASAPTPVELARSVPTLAQFSDDYITHCDTTNRPQHARSKAAIVKRDLLPAFGPLPLDQIGVRAIDAWRATMVARKLAPKTINNRVAVLMHALRTAHAWDLLDKVPKLKPLKAAQPEIGFL
jgi:hypothetical protein